MKTFEPPRTLEMGGDGNGLYPKGDEKGAFSDCKVESNTGLAHLLRSMQHEHACPQRLERWLDVWRFASVALVTCDTL
jgi:hypothetical protein